MSVYFVHTHANKDIYYEQDMRHVKIYLLIDIY